MHGLRLRFQKGDLLAVAVTLVLAAAVFFLFLPREDPGAAVAEIYLDGQLIDQLPLDTPAQLEVSGDYHNTITVRDGKVGVTASDCPGEDCVHSGFVGNSGRSIVCLPNRLETRIVSAPGDVDFIVG